MTERKSVGVIVGSTSITEFEFKCFDLVKVNDFIEVYHDGKWHVLHVIKLRREGEVLYAFCRCIGRTSDTPFKVGLNVYSASEENIRKVLGLTTDYSKSVYIGLLSNYNIKVYIPIDKLNRLFIVGKPGSGKSYTVGVLIEELLKKGIPILIIDVHGEYSSLKIPAKSGCKIFDIEPKNYIDQIIEFGDRRFSPAANIDIQIFNNLSIEDIVLTGKCVIINLRGLDLEDQVSMVASIVNKLLDAAISRRIPPFYLVVDEAHRFVGREKSESQVILRRFSQEGRKFGANLIVVSQRPQLLDITVRSLSGTWIIHRLSDPNDIYIAVESSGLSRDLEDSIIWLDVGECIIAGEAVDRIPYTVKVRCRETIHGGAGFNPLDYVSEETLRSAELKWKSLMKFETISKPVKIFEKPKITSLITQYYLPVKFNLNWFSNNFIDRFKFKFDFNNLELHYYPALEIKASIMVKRSRPNVEFNDEYKAFIPLIDEFDELDFSQNKAYYLDGFNEIDLSLTPIDFENIIYHPPKIDISILDSYEKLLNNLKKFISFKLSYKIHFSTKFKLYSKYNEDLNDFINRLKDVSKNLFNEASIKLINKYEGKISKHEKILKSLKDEIKIRVQTAKRIMSMINDLNSKLKNLNPTSKEYILISSKIQSLESKLAKLNKMISEANIELDRKEKVVNDLKRELNNKLKILKSEFDDIGEVKTISISLNKRDVNVDLIRLVWIPILMCSVKLSNDVTFRNLNFEWNCYNGFGNYSRCESCNSIISNIEDINFCDVCLAPLCSQHILKCSICGCIVCSEHTFRCGVCGNILCVNEKSYKCSICNTISCYKCVDKCIKCGSEISYCSTHLHKCNYCSESYCDKHFNEHLIKCSICNKLVCGKSIEHCYTCNKSLCTNCIIKCSVCGKIICKDHSWICAICNSKMCINEKRYICSICGKSFCSKHSFTCPSCGREICVNHVNLCPNCGRRICESCIITVKRLFTRKTGCKLCLKP